MNPPESAPTGHPSDPPALAALCRHCGDGTDPEDDPAPDLCVMCEKAGRTSAIGGRNDT